jgi:predicted nucleotidyltransferase
MIGMIRDLHMSMVDGEPKLRAAFRKGLEDKFDVDVVIDEYLKNEAEQIEINLKGEDVTEEQVVMAAKQNAAETFGQLMDRKKTELAESYAEYDINDLDNLSLITSALMVNDELYIYTKELKDNIKESEVI